ncbi:MAG: response regulator transcription factor [Actinobacteria bacterium]|nr:MAG: response regulator transcription factor [Actinomycetota bacterium]
MRILVTEDEPRILSFLARGLEAEGFAVDSAGDGAEALRRVEKAHYDLVVLDLLLPQVNGLTVLSELRRVQPELPVVILSARSDLGTKLRGFALGANDYVPKPFSLDELIARIRAHLRRGVPGDTNLVRVGRLTLDLARRRACLADLSADLSDREFRLLHYLALHPGEVVSRERLLAEVWGYHFDPGSNVVEVCIRRLRKKLGAEAPIETVRHAGYRLAEA